MGRRGVHSETCMRPHTFLTYLDQIAQYQGVHLSHLTFHPSPLTPHLSPLTPHPSPSPPPLTLSSPNTNMYFIHKIFFFNCFTDILTERIYIIYIKSQQDKNNFLSKTNWYVQKGGRGEGEGRERGRRGEGGEGEKNGGESVR